MKYTDLVKLAAAAGNPPQVKQQTTNLINSMPASHYANRQPEAKTRAYLGLKPGSDKAFWRNLYAGQRADTQAQVDYYNMLANAANTPGDHQRFYQYNTEPPYEAIRNFGVKSVNNQLYPFVRRNFLEK